MTTIVSLFGEKTAAFEALNLRAEEYAASAGLAWEWAPQIPYDRDEVVRRLSAADAGIIDVEPYGEEIFRDLGDRTRLLIRFGVGYDKVDLAAATRHGITVARTPGANTLGVAEMALSLILAARRKLVINQRCVESGQWARNVAEETIGSTIGIVGFGAIGRALAGLLAGFHCRVLAYDPFADEEVMRQAGVEPIELDDLFAAADVISLHVPYGPSTHNLVDARRLAMMKPTSVIVNTSRGGIIDEDALYQALVSGQIGAAGLDVFAQEPLPISSRLLTVPNLVVTPHVSSQTMQSLWRIYAMAIDVASGFFAGTGSPHLLNPEAMTHAQRQ